MADSKSRKNIAMHRLRQQLRKRQESLADQFDFKMYSIVQFKDDKKKPAAVFEMSEVIPIMTNNYEESILRGARDNIYSYESSKELLARDIVQLHSPRWQPLRKDVMGCATDIDFFLWPRNDIESIQCMLFSRWKGSDDQPFRKLEAAEAEFEFRAEDYEKQIIKLLSRKGKDKSVINNPAQSMFLFVNKADMESQRSRAVVFKLASVCVYLPQDRLTIWSPLTETDCLAPYH